MKKIININFQGRVIPIEETAYDILKTYVDSLRRHFVNEDGRDEIINDIESRIAELFSERLKRGSACITDDDVYAIIASIGRPEDFDQQDGEPAGASASSSSTASGSSNASGPSAASGQQQYRHGPATSSRLYRNADDKIIAGVCSGIANSLRVDPVIMRILFVLFFGVSFWVYIVLWIVVPVQSIKTNITKRLYRDPEQRAIGGVCSGLAAYFNTDIWIPRLIFGVPLLISILNGALHGPLFNFHHGLGFVSGSLVSTLVLVYVILWIVLPEATTTSEKLEMRGERIDLNSIRDTVKEDLQGLKGRSEKFGAEVKETAQQFGSRAASFAQQGGQRAQSFAAEAAPIARRTGSGLGNAIGVLFKIFFFFIGGCIVVSLLAVLVSLFGAGVAIMPFKDYILDGPWQSLLAWCILILFVGVPIVAIIVWIIRRIIGVKSRNHYIGYTFAMLWIIGLFCFIALAVSVKRNFDYWVPVQQDYSITQPVNGKLTVRVANSTVRYYGAWWGGNWNGPFNLTDDSLVVKNVRVKIEKSRDSVYHVFAIKASNGSSVKQAEEFARTLGFQVNQQDSTLYLDNGFSLPSGQKFRNQQVLVTVQVPLGKRVLVDRSVSRRYHWFIIDRGRNDNWNWDWEDDSEKSYYYSDGVEYIMTTGGLERTDGKDKKNTGRRYNNNEDDNDDNSNTRFKDNATTYRYKQIEDSLTRRSKDKLRSIEQDNKYRYQEITDSIKLKAKEKLREEMRIKDSLNRERKLKEVMKTGSVNTKMTSAHTKGKEEDMPGNHLTFSPVLIFSVS